MKKALITGISGQDGSYLTELLLEKGYEVYGMVRRHSVAENQSYRLAETNNQIKTFYGDLADAQSVIRVLEEVEPQEIYNLGAMSQVRISTDIPAFTLETNTLGVLNMLEATKRICPGARFYQASSSEMFGNSIDNDGCQRLTTPMLPVSPYGISKLASYHLVRHYRGGHNLHACNGILFNHESPRRGTNFVTNKVVKQAVEISKGLRTHIYLGNIDSSRDWGHSKDYVRAMWYIMQHDEARDWVVATGESHTVREMGEYVFNKLGLNFYHHLVVDEDLMRPQELKYLRGDSSEIRKFWEPTYTFETMLDEMIDHWRNHV